MISTRFRFPWRLRSLWIKFEGIGDKNCFDFAATQSFYGSNAYSIEVKDFNLVRCRLFVWKGVLLKEIIVTGIEIRYQRFCNKGECCCITCHMFIRKYGILGWNLRRRRHTTSFNWHLMTTYATPTKNSSKNPPQINQLRVFLHFQNRKTRLETLGRVHCIKTQYFHLYFYCSLQLLDKKKQQHEEKRIRVFACVH